MRLIKTVLSFEGARRKDGCALMNGRLPRHQRNVLDSIIRQVQALTPEQDGAEPASRPVAPRTGEPRRASVTDFPIASSLDAATYALRPMRIGPNEVAVHYRDFSFDHPFAGCEQLVRQLEAGGSILACKDRLQGEWFLDALDSAGDILETFALTASGVRYLRRRGLIRKELAQENA